VAVGGPRSNLGIAVLLSSLLAAPAAVSALSVQILHPPPGFKLRAGETLAIHIQVDAIADVSWRLSIDGDGDGERVLNADATIVEDDVVAQLNGGDLSGGTHYTLSLAGTGDGISAYAEVRFLVPNEKYRTIPLEAGNLSRSIFLSYTGDAAARLLAYSQRLADPALMTLFDREVGHWETLSLPLGASDSVRFTGDSSRLYFIGTFPVPGGLFRLGLGFLDIESRILSFAVPEPEGVRFAVQNDGTRVAYQGHGSNGIQYFLYEEETQRTLQLTDDPDSVIVSLDPEFCPRPSATVPMMAADGSSLVIVTSATLGIVPEDDSVGCRVFQYHVRDGSWKHVADIPKDRTVSIPALDLAGTKLSFLVVRTLPNGVRRGFPGMLDIETSTLMDPVVDVGDFTTFDAVVTGDGRGIVISTQADLDPGVGNADHNLELFYYDIQTGDFSQISETVGGIGKTPGNCPSYNPYVSSDGQVVMFPFILFSSERCAIDGTQRHERNGFVFRSVRAVRIRAGNLGPDFTVPSDIEVFAGDALVLDLTASDPDGDPITFFAQLKDGIDVPPGSEMIDHHDGTATFRWPTKPEHAGEYVLRVAAFDEGGGEVFQDVTISVVPRGGPTLTATTTRTATVTPTATSTLAEEPTENTLPTATAAPTVEASPTATVFCPGDCNEDGRVGVNEILMGTRIALGLGEVSDCPAFDCHGSGIVTIDCLTRGIDAAINGCP
jgi:hypothetical protein